MPDSPDVISAQLKDLKEAMMQRFNDIDRRLATQVPVTDISPSRRAKMNDDKTGDALRVDASDLIDELSRRLTTLARENAILSIQLRQAQAAGKAGE